MRLNEVSEGPAAEGSMLSLAIVSLSVLFDECCAIGKCSTGDEEHNSDLDS